MMASYAHADWHALVCPDQEWQKLSGRLATGQKYLMQMAQDHQQDSDKKGLSLKTIATHS